MIKQIKNIYNRPLFYSGIISIVNVIILSVTLYYYVARPYTRYENSLFPGAALFQDVMNIFWGYVVVLAIMICGLTGFNLSYQAKRSDYPKVAAVITRFSIIGVVLSIILAVWFTLQVISSFR